jgi:hypothetical protein
MEQSVMHLCHWTREHIVCCVRGVADPKDKELVIVERVPSPWQRRQPPTFFHLGHNYCFFAAPLSVRQ